MFYESPCYFKGLFTASLLTMLFAYATIIVLIIASSEQKTIYIDIQNTTNKTQLNITSIVIQAICKYKLSYK